MNKYTLDFYELVDVLTDYYVDNWNINDSDEEVEAWLQAAAPALKFKVDNVHCEFIVINSEELLDKTFVYDTDTWYMEVGDI